MSYRFLFRGTTLGYKGNLSTLRIPRTSTSSHPVKAIWFALECRRLGQPVVYLFDTQRLQHFYFSVNCLHHLESEIAFDMTPEQFYLICEGYILCSDFQIIMKKFGIDTYHAVRKENLSQFCTEAPPINEETISAIVTEMRNYIKK